MPITPTFPGVYIEEVPSGVRTIVGVATAITAFVGSANRGPTNEPQRISNFGDFERTFGGVDVNSMLSYAVQQFFLNGGSDAVIVRVANTSDAVKAKIDAGGLQLQAAGEGNWGNRLRATVDHKTRDPNDTRLFNLLVQEIAKNADGKEFAVLTESFRNVSVDPDSPRFVQTIVDQESQLLDVVAGGVPAGQSPGDGAYDAQNGADGSPIRDVDVRGTEADRSGIFSLEKTDLFNILCIPPLKRDQSPELDTIAAAGAYCLKRRAIYLVDPEIGKNTVKNGTDRVEAVRNAIGNVNARNAAFFFPNLRMPDERKENRLQEFVPSGSVAGVMAVTDQQRGVWKSPAGIEAGLVGVRELSFRMTDDDNGQLNPEGVNCIRNFPVYGTVVWGSRTLLGSDRLASEWKYLAVRRTTLFIEESLFRGTKWVVFEPNDEPLWAEIRLNVGAFMQNLFRQGAFQGKSPREAYFVRCGSDTTTQNDINLGIVNIEVGFAPLKPAEFVIIKIQQMAGNIET